MDMINCYTAGDTYEGVPGMTFEEFAILTKRLEAAIRQEDVMCTHADIPPFIFWCFYIFYFHIFTTFILMFLIVFLLYIHNFYIFLLTELLP